MTEEKVYIHACGHRYLVRGVSKPRTGLEDVWYDIMVSPRGHNLIYSVSPTYKKDCWFSLENRMPVGLTTVLRILGEDPALL